MKRSVQVASVLGIPIKINYSWLIVFGLVVFTLAKGYFPFEVPGLAEVSYWLMAIAASLLLFTSLLLHELSHSAVAIKNDLPIRGITLFVFGGVAQMEREPQDPKTEFKMAIAGPICSLVIALIFFAITNLLYFLRAPMAVIVVTDYLMLLNIGVAIFNLIPGFPLDGGRVLRATLWAYFKDMKKATRIASNFGKAFAYLLMAFGILNLFSTSFINGIWLIFIGLFLLEAAETSYQQVAMKNILSGIRVRDIMTKDVVVVDASEKLDKLVHDDFFRYRFTSFPVIEHNSLIGLLTLHNVRDVEREKWTNTTAKDAMIPLSRAILTHPDVEIMDALTKMATSGVGRLIVVQDHSILGILSQRDVMRLFEVRVDLEA